MSEQKADKRPIYAIAWEISKLWKNVHYAARPYLSAMREMTTVDEAFISENGRNVIRYFLANAGTWRGEDAKRIKAELKALLK